jgi:hypothetical protein
MRCAAGLSFVGLSIVNACEFANACLQLESIKLVVQCCVVAQAHTPLSCRDACGGVVQLSITDSQSFSQLVLQLLASLSMSKYDATTSAHPSGAGMTRQLSGQIVALTDQLLNA